MTASLPLTTAGEEDDQDARIRAWAERVAAEAPPMSDDVRARVSAALRGGAE